LHRFLIILSKFEEDTEYSEFLAKISGEFEEGDGKKSTEIDQILEAILNQKVILKLFALN
jgi:hypothetical protein